MGIIKKDLQKSTKRQVQSGHATFAEFTGVYVGSKRQADLPTIMKHTYDDGYRAGHQAGVAASHESVQKILAEESHHLTRIIDSALRERDGIIKELDGVVVSLSILIAKRILHREVENPSDTTLEQIREGIRKVLGVDRVKIKVNPSELEILRGHRNDILAASDMMKDIIFEGDSKIESGGCIIETDIGTVDARIETQVSQILAALEDVI